MWIAVVRLLLLSGMVAVAIASEPLPWGIAANAALGVALAVAAIFLETRIRSVTAKEIAGGFLGALAGVLFALLVSVPLAKIPMAPQTQVFVQSLALLLFTYVGLMLGFTRGEWFDPLSVVAYFRGTTTQKNKKILDTSVIIDGRIADICETGFMDGTLIIPQFVLKELQQVADSADSLKRNRGRRGLDILQKVRKMSGIDVEISELDFPEVKEVDLKIIELAKEMDAKIVTNDFNLNKVAQVRGVLVLNINELANALKPVVLPGEFMRVFILKEGKEYNQGVAYLDDGTMVVVDNARKLLGKNVDITVTSVLQTTAGKMIFGKTIEGPGARASRHLPRVEWPPEVESDRLAEAPHALLVHPAGHGLYRRLRRGFASARRLLPKRRPLAPRRESLGMAHPQDLRREGRSRGPREPCLRANLRARFQPPEPFRYSDPLRVSAPFVPHPLQEVPEPDSLPRLAPVPERARGSGAGESVEGDGKPGRSRESDPVGDLRRGVPRRNAELRRGDARLSQGELSARFESGHARGPADHLGQPFGDEAGESYGVPEKGATHDRGADSRQRALGVRRLRPFGTSARYG